MTSKSQLHFRNINLSIFLLTSFLWQMAAVAQDLINPDSVDPHITELGIWDLHVCNWPDRHPFYLTTFKTEHYENIQSIEVFSPTGLMVGSFDMNKLLTFKREGLPELKVLISQLPMLSGQPSGWFSAHVNTKDGKHYLTRDYLIMNVMDRAGEISPVHQSEVSTPWELSWAPVHGAKRYRVWIRDMWEGDKQIFDSGYIQASKIELPEGLLKPGGAYSWRIHSRDTHPHVLLGDFNHGSLTQWNEFTVLED